MRTTTFFFTKIPDEFGSREMYALLKENGDIDEVTIPPKRDKRGKSFGFVRFFNVKDARVLAVKLDNIIIGSNKYTPTCRGSIEIMAKGLSQEISAMIL